MSSESGRGEWVVRPMRPDDVPAAERLSAEGFYELDVRNHRPGLPDPQLRSASRSVAWTERTAHFLETDPGGCWVAEDASGMVGFATSFKRELTWCLATFAVRAEQQGRGIGRVLLQAATQHGQNCLRGMLSASSDARAIRLYWAAGFTLHPQMFLVGTVDRSTIPLVEKVREGSAGDIELMDSLDRRTRGSAHGPDHPLMLSWWRLLVSDTSTGSGYVYTSGSCVELLAASNRRTAARLLWAVLADADGDVLVPHLTAANAWAVDLGLTARLELHQAGYLGLRGMKPPAPYVHNGALL
jgi:ribosomal protein S18 acetylase RimI-like enzyme